MISAAAAATGHRRHTVSFLACVSYAELTGRVLMAVRNHGENGMYLQDEAGCSDVDLTSLEARIRTHLASSTIVTSTEPRECVVAACSGKPMPATSKPSFPMCSPPLGLKVEQLESKRGLLRAWRRDLIPVVRLSDKLWDVAFMDLLDPKLCQEFFLTRISPTGFLLTVGSVSDPISRPNLLKAIDEAKRWSKTLKASNIAEVNKAMLSRESALDLCLVSEALHEEKLAKIAAAIVASSTHLALIAGPSSSGKTTFAYRLAIHLRSSGASNVVVISMDDYYLDRDKMPSNDFEDPNGLDLPLLKQRMRKLLMGEVIPQRRFDFKLGVGYDDPKKTMQLGPQDYIVMEGIHALNPLIFEGIVPTGGKPNLIYISAITPLGIDDQHPVSTSDTRLCRRILRDAKTRGYTATQTISRWGSVRSGEERFIFPFQENADHWFNSALVYEHNALAVGVRSLLSEIDQEESVSEEVMVIAKRLENFLSCFYPLEIEGIVPSTSLLREFVGGSVFNA